MVLEASGEGMPLSLSLAGGSIDCISRPIEGDGIERPRGLVNFAP